MLVLTDEQEKILKEIYEDCVMLEKRKDLSEYGAGRGDLAAYLLGKWKEPFKFVK